MPTTPDQPLVDAAAAAAYVRGVTGKPCAPSTIRSLASRGHLTRHGRDGRRTLYGLVELHIHLTGEHPYELTTV